MVNGADGLGGLPVHKLVVMVYALDTERVTILHPPTVVRTVKERQSVNVAAIEKLVLLVSRKFISNQLTLYSLTKFHKFWRLLQK